MDKEFSFFCYLLESYAYYKEIDTGDLLKMLDEKGLTDIIFSMYEIYHQEAIENAFKDIDELIRSGKYAW